MTNIDPKEKITNAPGDSFSPKTSKDDKTEQETNAPVISEKQVTNSEIDPQDSPEL